MKTAFEEYVSIKYSLYNSLFLNLPFSGITDTGNLLPLLHKVCESGISQKIKPDKILESFFEKHASELQLNEKIDLLFRFVQYIERQVVLFDAIEDADFEKLNNLKGKGTLHELIKSKNKTSDREKLLDLLNNYSVRIVLTAHPTQFYPGHVLSIITDLEKAIRANDLNDVQEILQQLGRTRFYKREKPSPLDEAVSLIWFLENVFYNSIGEILRIIDEQFGEAFNNNRLFELGFWPGGDRDGNPYVDEATTLATAEMLRKSILSTYIDQVFKLKRRITFPKAEHLIRSMEENLRFAYHEKGGYEKADEMVEDIKSLKEIMIKENNSLYLDRITGLERKVMNFGFHFATIDLRQDSRIHHEVIIDILNSMGFNIEEYEEMDFTAKSEWLGSLTKKKVDYLLLEDMTARTLQSIEAMIKIQERNGARGCNRYIISNTRKAENLIELLFLIMLVYKGKEAEVDILPLFETIEDLNSSAEIMQLLYDNKFYRDHLKQRNDQQTIMLGFSDGTKDGGYLTANWSILRAKEELSIVAGKNNIELVFFDGRGGPPARGGGKTHAFYSSLPPSIQNKAIHLTVQGQTISSNFGTVDAARYNLELLLTAGISNYTEGMPEQSWSKSNRGLLEELSVLSYSAYMKLRKDDNFLDYLGEMTVLRFYGQTNIGSRPGKRSKTGGLSLDNLRAIPYVGSWSQMKQNVPGYYGFGYAIQKLASSGKINELQRLYHENRFFEALVANSMQSLTKTNFVLTNYLEKHPRFSGFWKNIKDEYEQSIKSLLKVSQMPSLMADTTDGKKSIIFRQNIILPLLVIQQTAMMKLQDSELSNEEREIWENLVIRCFFGNINATRNAA